MNLKVNILFSLATLIILIAGYFTIRYAVDHIRDQRELARLQAHTRDWMAQAKIEKSDDFHQTLDQIRVFINDNSEHRIDDEFYSVWRDHFVMNDALFNHALGKTKKLPPFECSTRSSLMRRILDQLGYESRIVHIYDADRDLSSHTFVEILNPETQTWEIQDPSYDIYWQNIVTGERADIFDLMRDPARFEPCGRGECGLQYTSHEGFEARKLLGFFDIASISQKEDGVRYSVYNENVDPAKTYTLNGKTGKFCEIFEKFCETGFMPLSAIKSVENR